MGVWGGQGELETPAPSGRQQQASSGRRGKPRTRKSRVTGQGKGEGVQDMGGGFVLRNLAVLRRLCPRS